MIVIKKSFEYQGDNEGKDVGSMIYLDDAATVTIESMQSVSIFKIFIFQILVCCRFQSTQRASSDQISIEAGQSVAGKLDAVGSWEGSLKIEFTDNAFAVKKTDAVILGETHYVKVSWTVEKTSPLAKKVNW